MGALRKIIIVDDEPLIVSGLSENIDWAAIGGDVVGTACNGEAALHLIEETVPDIVISDIVMPVCTGLRLAEICGERYPNTKVILLSAYSDFEYARQAIRLNVVDYVLKPIEPEKLTAAVRSAIEELREQEGLFSHVSKLEKETLAARQLAASFLLFESAQHGVPCHGTQEELHQNAEELVQKPGVVLALRFYNIPRANASACKAAAGNVFLTSLRKSGLRLFSRTEDTGITVLCQLPHREEAGTGREKIEGAVRTALREIHAEMPEAKQMVSACAMTSPYRNALQLKQAYQTCVTQIRKGFFAEADSILYAENAGEIAVQETGHDLELVVHALKNGNAQQLCEALDPLLDKTRDAQDPDAAALLFRALNREAMRVCALSGISALREEEAGYEQENFAEKSRRLKVWLLAICSYMEGSRDIVRKTQQLIQTNFSDSSFGLSAAADQMRVSTSYLSRLFKKKTGENFIDSLLSKRLEYARFLLTTTAMNVAEIAESVGFTESAYFAQVFKKTCGCTPSQYREQNRFPDRR